MKKKKNQPVKVSKFGGWVMNDKYSKARTIMQNKLHAASHSARSQKQKVSLPAINLKDEP